MSGTLLDVLTGDQAADTRAAARAWRDAGSTSGDIVVRSKDNMVADVVSTKTNTVLARIYVTPPFGVAVNTCHFSLPTKRVAFFTPGHTFLVYEVC